MGETKSASRRPSTQTVTGLIVVGTTSGMALPLLIWLMRDPHWFASDLLGIRAQAAQIPWAWALAGIVAISYIAYTFWAVPFVKDHATTFTLLKALAVPLALVSGTLEELLFRKLLMDWLHSLDVSLAMQVLATAITFGLAHSLWAFFSRDARIILPVVLATTMLGGLLGITYLVGERNVLPVIVAHVLVNLVIEPWLLLSAINGRWDSTDSVERDEPAAGCRDEPRAP